MTAAVVEDFTRPLVVKQVPKPVPGAHEILVRVETTRGSMTPPSQISVPAGGSG